MDKKRIAKRQTKLDFSNTAKSNSDYFSHINKMMIYSHCAVRDGEVKDSTDMAPR